MSMRAFKPRPLIAAFDPNLSHSMLPLDIVDCTDACLITGALTLVVGDMVHHFEFLAMVLQLERWSDTCGCTSTGPQPQDCSSHGSRELVTPYLLLGCLPRKQKPCP